MYFTWIQEKTLAENTTNSQNLLYLNHHLIKRSQIHYVVRLTAKELYLKSVQQETITPTSQKYFESIFQDLTLQWKHIYTLPRITAIHSKLLYFQCKILHNIMYLNKRLFLFRKHNTSLGSFCNLEAKTVTDLFL